MADKPPQPLPWPEVDYAAFGPVEARAPGRVQQHVGRVMQRNWTRIPHVTHHDDVDITGFEQRREAWNAEHPERKRALLPALVKASVAALRRFPQFNSSLSADGATQFFKNYFHIGIAVDVPGGLLVPVLRDCDSRDLDALAADIARLSAKARDKGLSMDEMSGGCFTLSSLGHIGGTGFTPIINAPEVAILGVCRSRQLFLPDQEGRPVPRLMLPLSLSYDHRVINGADAARFVRALGEELGTIEFA